MKFSAMTGLLALAFTALASPTATEKRQAAFPNATAKLFVLPGCLETGLGAGMLQVNNIPPNQCQTSEDPLELPMGRLTSFKGYVAGAVPAGSTCEFQVFFKSGCQGVSIANHRNTSPDAGACYLSGPSPQFGSTDLTALSYKWDCYTTPT